MGLRNMESKSSGGQATSRSILLAAGASRWSPGQLVKCCCCSLRELLVMNGLYIPLEREPPNGGGRKRVLTVKASALLPSLSPPFRESALVYAPSPSLWRKQGKVAQKGRKYRR